MYKYKSFKVRYCIKCGENIVYEVIHGEDGSKEYICYNKGSCQNTCEIPYNKIEGKPLKIKRNIF